MLALDILDYSPFYLVDVCQEGDPFTAVFSSTTPDSDSLTQEPFLLPAHSLCRGSLPFPRAASRKVITRCWLPAALIRLTDSVAGRPQ